MKFSNFTSSNKKFYDINSDINNLEREYSQSMGSANYTLNNATTFNPSITNCYNGYTKYGGNSSSFVDVESDLLRINYKQTKDITKQFKPYTLCTSCNKCNAGIPCNCSHCIEDPHRFKQDDCSSGIFKQIETRVSKACSNNYLSPNRFEELPINPQQFDKIYSNDSIGMSSRDINKNNIRRLRK